MIEIPWPFCALALLICVGGWWAYAATKEDKRQLDAKIEAFCAARARKPDHVILRADLCLPEQDVDKDGEEESERTIRRWAADRFYNYQIREFIEVNEYYDPKRKQFEYRTCLRVLKPEEDEKCKADE